METALWVVVLLVAGSQLGEGSLSITPQYDTYYHLAPEALELQCSSSSGGSYSWEKDGSGISNGATYTIDSSAGTLTKSSTSTTDSGVYRCTAGSDSISINVQVFSVATTSGSYTSHSTPVVLRCEPTFVSGHSASYELTWKRSDSRDISDTTKYSRDTQNHSLTITEPYFNSDTDDSGEYYCGFKFSTTPVREVPVSVYVYAGPKMGSFGKSVTFTEGDTSILNCRAYSYPKANITWLYENATITSDRISYAAYNGYDNGQLVLSSPRITDRGNYMCLAHNSYLNTYANRTVLLRVKGRLAWLWPLIGIIAQILVLIVIILVGNYKCPKTQPSSSDAGADNSEPQPGTSRSSPGEVRKRTTHL